MGLEALQLLERADPRVVIIEVNHESHGDQIVSPMVEKRTSAGVIVERPAEGVLYEPRAVLLGWHLPELFEADTELGRIVILLQSYFAMSALVRLPRAPSAKSVYFPRSSMPRVKPGLGCPSLPTPMSPVATPRTSPRDPYSTSVAAKPG